VLALLLLWRLWLDNATVCTKEYAVASPAFPAGFEGFRIAQITDLHGRSNLYRALVRETAEARPDVIVLTGDISDREDQWSGLEELLAELTAIAPCYYVSGNHEWADLDAEVFFSRLRDAGVTLLRNDWVFLERGGDTLALAGVEDPNGYADMPTPEDVCEELRQVYAGSAVALCHRPELFPRLAAGGMTLTLSGHVHGGLIRLPFVGGLIGPGGWFPDYDKGLYTLGDGMLLVSPGIAGSNGVPRLFNRPELTVAVLHSEKG
jgi:predicted MPP superfamily phosphohydrolase